MKLSDVSPQKIANAIGIDLARLWSLAKNISIAYRPRELRPVGKKHRPIDPMFKWSKKLFRKLHRWIQNEQLSHPRAHGGVKGRSCFTSANVHLGRRFIWTRDAANCYPSITPAIFHAEMLALGFSADTAELLSMLSTVRDSIPQGSPLSNDALNLFLWRVDQALSSFCGRTKLGYSRVADDFVVSGNNRQDGFGAIRLLERLLVSRGIQINQKKRRKSGFMLREQKPEVHSILVNNRRGTAINDEHHKCSIETAQRYLAACKAVQPDSLQAVAQKRARVAGWMHYCRQAQFSPARAIRQLLEAGDKAVRRKLQTLKLSAHKGKWWLATKKQNEPRRLANLWRKRVAVGSVILPATTTS